MAQWLTNPTRSPEVAASIPGLAQWVKWVAAPMVRVAELGTGLKLFHYLQCKK